MKKIYRFLAILLGVIIIACLVILLKTNNFNSIRFKKEYETINGNETSSGKIIRDITIPTSNPFIYKSAEDIVKALEKNESFIVYFGFAKCPWCRSVLPTLIQAAKDLKISKIYYVDILEIRDTLKLDENNEVQVEKEGTAAYYTLLEKFSDVLSDYTLKDSEKNKISTGEKRIYAPNIVKVENGKPVSMTTGISDLQADAYEKITEEMLEDTYNKFYEIMK